MHSYKTSIHSYSYKTLPNILTKHSITFLQNTPIHSYKTSIHSYKTYIHSYKTFLCIPTKHLYIPTKHSQTFIQNTQGLWCCKRAGTEAPSHAQQVLQRYWHDCTGLLCSVEESQRVSVALYISVLRERERYIYMRNCDIIAIKRSTRLLYQCHNT